MSSGLDLFSQRARLAELYVSFISAPPRDRTNYSTHKKADKAAGGDIAVNIGASILFLYSVSDRWATPPDHDILPVPGHSHRMRHHHQTSNTHLFI